MCYFPISLKNNVKERSINNSLGMVVPCGKCLDCRRSRSRNWIFRLLNEKDISISSYFITLTYDEENISFTKNGLPTLVKKDFQNFMKILRKKNKAVIKYYACGEYGKLQRPHFHAIIFNVLDSNFIDSSWGRGFVTVDEVNSSSIAYVTGYVNKYMIRYNKHEDDDRLKEFNLISKGLGISFLQNADIVRDYIYRSESDKWQKNGDFFSIPRYYKEKIGVDDNLKAILQEKRQKMFLSINSLNREAQKALYDERNLKILQSKLDKFKNLKM